MHVTNAKQTNLQVIIYPHINITFLVADKLLAYFFFAF